MDDYPYDVGSYSRKVTTNSGDAQRWFDRGLNWCFGFHHEEALACFEKALASDPDCAMAHWGVGYAAGPNYNFPWELMDPAGKAASGDVVWSASAQRGFMRFTGLAPNDPTKLQYQLWIFDKDRDERYPVDGGVFDVGSTGEVIVPISAKLHVASPTLFSVTVEQPGGVVVSKRERIVVTAAPHA